MAAAAWLLGVSLGAGGRYGAALTVLSPLVESGTPDGAPAERRLFAALAVSILLNDQKKPRRPPTA